MTIVSTPSGIGYEVNGRVFQTPSGAAKSITRTEVNGWGFWRID